MSTPSVGFIGLGTFLPPVTCPGEGQGDGITSKMPIYRTKNRAVIKMNH